MSYKSVHTDILVHSSNVSLHLVLLHHGDRYIFLTDGSEINSLNNGTGLCCIALETVQADDRDCGFQSPWDLLFPSAWL